MIAPPRGVTRQGQHDVSQPLCDASALGQAAAQHIFDLQALGLLHPQAQPLCQLRRLGPQLDALRGQQLGQRQIVCAVNPAQQTLLQLRSRQFGNCRANGVLVDRAARTALPQQTHQFVQRSACAAQCQVQTQGDH